MVNAPGADAYSIAGVTWLLVYQDPHDITKAKTLVRFLTWAETEGQKIAPELNFAPLPENMQGRILAEIKSISSGG